MGNIRVEWYNIDWIENGDVKSSCKIVFDF